MNKERKEYIASCAISELCEETLGGYRQKFLIEGYENNSPLLLILHGGPGFCVPFCVGARGLFPNITRKFTAVYWDQLGCGINNRKIDDGFHISTFVDMTCDLARYLKTRFEGRKLFVFAMSWGSVLAALAAEKEPELFDGVYTAGQVVLPPLVSEAAYTAVLSSKAPKRLKVKIQKFRDTPKLTVKEMVVLSKAVRKYTDAYKQPDDADTDNAVRGIFSSKDYRFRDKLACFVNGYAKNKSILEELAEVDLTDTLSNITVPYEIYGGTRDLVTPLRESLNVVEAAGNPRLTCTQVEGMGHIPSLAAQKEIFEKIVKAAGV